ncbi:MAG: DUF2892 domain-containing protein [Bacteroidetes bacterium]|nr:MAG: DUF2892 domain-containing protein [Bacteroidota bacterium]
MKTNMGGTDKVVRVIIALMFIALYATGTVSGTLAYVLLVLAGVFILTSVLSFCPLYTIFGLNTCTTAKKP